MVFGRQDHYSLYLLIVVKSLIYGRYHVMSDAYMRVAMKMISAGTLLRT